MQKVAADLRKPLADPGVHEKLQHLGDDTMDMSPAESVKFAREENDTCRRVVTAAGIKPQ